MAYYNEYKSKNISVKYIIKNLTIKQKYKIKRKWSIICENPQCNNQCKELKINVTNTVTVQVNTIVKARQVIILCNLNQNWLIF